MENIEKKLGISKGIPMKQEQKNKLSERMKLAWQKQKEKEIKYEDLI